MDGRKRQIALAATGAALCLLLSVALSQFFPAPMLIVVLYFFAVGARLRGRVVWLLPLVPVVLAFVLSPSDTFWLVGLGLVAIPGWLGTALGRGVGRFRGRATTTA